MYINVCHVCDLHHLYSVWIIIQTVKPAQVQETSIL